MKVTEIEEAIFIRGDDDKELAERVYLAAGIA